MAVRSLFKVYFKSEQDALTDVLREAHLFRDIDERSLRMFRKMMHVRSYAPDEIVFREGQPGNGMYVVIDGEVRIVLNHGKQHETELARLGRGEFFGEFNLLGELPRSASALTTTSATLGGFFRPDLLELIERNPRLGVRVVLNLGEVLAQRLRRSNQELRDARQRLRQLEEG